MRWINKLERKYGRYGIPNLMKYIVAGQAIVFLLLLMQETMLSFLLGFHPGLVLQGQIWRIVSFIFIPPSTSPIFAFFVLYFYYWVGTGLEHEWGTFKFNLFYLTAMLLTILASTLTFAFVGTALYLNMALFLAFAQIYPDFEIRLFLVLPIKVKHLAWVNLIFIAYTLIFGGVAAKAMAIVPLATFMLFFGDVFIRDLIRRRQVQSNRKRFFSEIEKARRNRE